MDCHSCAVHVVTVCQSKESVATLAISGARKALLKALSNGPLSVWLKVQRSSPESQEALFSDPLDVVFALAEVGEVLKTQPAREKAVAVKHNA